MPPSTDPVLLTREGRLAHLLLNRGDEGNSFNLAMVTALSAAARSASEWAADAAVGALLISADGGNFCVGGDLKEFAAQGDGLSGHVSIVADRAHDAIQALADLPIPVVCAVRGAAAGGGLGLLCVADVVVAERSAKFRVAYTAIGLSPDCGTSWYLPRLVGPRRAMDLALTNPAVDAAAAERIGLVSRVVDDGTGDDVARALAAQLADGPTESLRATKALMRAGATASLPDHLAAEAESISSLAGQEYGAGAIAAFASRASRKG